MTSISRCLEYARLEPEGELFLANEESPAGSVCEEVRSPSTRWAGSEGEETPRTER